MEVSATPRVISVREGKVIPDASWLYVWIDIDAARIVYIGATGFDPELRAHLHLTHEESAIGRVRAEVPNSDSGQFDVLTFSLPAGTVRPEAKRALIAALTAKRLWNSSEQPKDDDPLVAPMAEAVERYLASHTQPAA